MILTASIVIPFAAGLLAWLAEKKWNGAARRIALGSLILDLALVLSLWRGAGGGERWIAELQASWIPRFGMSFHLAMDGLGLLLVLLSLALGLLAIVASWTEIRDRAGFFYFNLLWTVAGLVGVFLAIDLLLFYFFFELMLIPMVFLIAIWGHENRIYAAIKFFLFTQAGGLLMLVSILALAYFHRRANGRWSFDYEQLLGLSLDASTSMWLMLGFFLAFAVKLPAVPLHTWLPDAHTQAPTAGSVLLAGVMLKTGGYGLIRFAVPLFPGAAASLAPVAMVVGVAGILYGALLAFAQTDFKRLIAYSSVSHLGFVLLGVFAGGALAVEGAVVQMLAHGVSTGALFAIAGALEGRVHTRDTERLGGLWSAAPRLSALGLFFALASLGLPGLANFVGEFLVLLGTYQQSAVLAGVAVFGLVAAAIYSLRFVQDLFHGPRRGPETVFDLTRRETAMLGAAAIVIVWLGLFPGSVLKAAAPSVEGWPSHFVETLVQARGAAP